MNQVKTQFISFIAKFHEVAFIEKYVGTLFRMNVMLAYDRFLEGTLPT